ncbi:MAG: hypothetical protein EAZ08_13440 [Cytophagales bacterium]|nr:MAG: hypothetical protein EAZ08_13440 [Cytophagales bacterium]
MLFSHFKLKKIIFFIYFSMFTHFSYAHHVPLSISDDFAEKRISEHFSYFIDRHTLALGIDEISKQSFSEIPYKRHILNFDFINFNYSEKTVWLKFEVNIEKALSNKEFFLEIKSPLLDQIEFYHYSDGAWHGQVTGGHYPLRKRLFAYRTYVFDIKPMPSQTNTYYLKITTSDMMTVYPILYERETFIKTALNEQMGFGILYGLLAAILGINLIFAFLYKKVIYNLFIAVIAIGIFIIVRINGHSYIYLWAGVPWWENRALPMFILVFVILLSLFGYRLLNKAIERFFYRLIVFNIVISSVAFIITLFNPSSWIISTATCIGLFNVLALFLISVYEILRGEKENKYFVTASYLFFIGVLLTFFRFFEIIETNSFLGSYGFEIGFIAFVSLATVSLQMRRKQGQI